MSQDKIQLGRYYTCIFYKLSGIKNVITTKSRCGFNVYENSEIISKEICTRILRHDLKSLTLNKRRNILLRGLQNSTVPIFDRDSRMV